MGVDAVKLAMRKMITLVLIFVISFLAWTMYQKYYIRDDLKSPHILVMMKSLDPQMEFWNTVNAGIEVAKKEFDVEPQIVGPKSEYDVSGQIKMLEEALKLKPDAVILVASDYQALVPWAEKIRKKGIPLVIIDSGINSTIQNSFIATDNIAAGRKMGEVLSKLVDPTKRIAIVSHVQGSLTAIQREEGARSGISASLKIEGPFFCNGSQKEAYEITKKLLKEQPDIGGIAGLNEISTLGAAQAIHELGLTGKVKLVGFDSSKSEILWIEKGVIQAVVIQKPFNMGYLGIKTVYQAFKGEKVQAIIDTGSEVITKENMYTVENQKLLFPFVDP
jgi:ribose transport system substrate-binding protein